MGAYLATLDGTGQRTSLRIGTNGSQMVLAAAVIAGTALRAPTNERRRLQAWLETGRRVGGGVYLWRGSNKGELAAAVRDGHGDETQPLHLYPADETIRRGRTLPYAGTSWRIEGVLEFYDAALDYAGGPRPVTDAMRRVVAEAAQSLAEQRGPDDGWARTVAEAAGLLRGAAQVDIG